MPNLVRPQINKAGRVTKSGRQALKPGPRAASVVEVENAWKLEQKQAAREGKKKARRAKKAAARRAKQAAKGPGKRGRPAGVVKLTKARRKLAKGGGGFHLLEKIAQGVAEGAGGAVAKRAEWHNYFVKQMEKAAPPELRAEVAKFLKTQGATGVWQLVKTPQLGAARPDWAARKIGPGGVPEAVEASGFAIELKTNLSKVAKPGKRPPSWWFRKAYAGPRKYAEATNPRPVLCFLFLRTSTSPDEFRYYRATLKHGAAEKFQEIEPKKVQHWGGPQAE